MDNKKRIKEILEKYEQGIITKEEVKELQCLVDNENKKQEIKDFNDFANNLEDIMFKKLWKG